MEKMPNGESGEKDSKGDEKGKDPKGNGGKGKKESENAVEAEEAAGVHYTSQSARGKDGNRRIDAMGDSMETSETHGDN